MRFNKILLQFQVLQNTETLLLLQQNCHIPESSRLKIRIIFIVCISTYDITHYLNIFYFNIALASLSTAGLIMKVKELHDIAYKLGVDESKEMTRGKYLNIFSKSNQS